MTRLIFCFAMLIASVQTGLSADNEDSGVNTQDVANACLQTAGACKQACAGMGGGKKFSAEFARQGCDMGCDAAFKKCKDSIALKKGAGGAQTQDGQRKALGQ